MEKKDCKDSQTYDAFKKLIFQFSKQALQALGNTKILIAN